MNVSVGKMDIVWRTRFGDRGRIQTGQLKASVGFWLNVYQCLLHLYSQWLYHILLNSKLVLKILTFM